MRVASSFRTFHFGAAIVLTAVSLQTACKRPSPPEVLRPEVEEVQPPEPPLPPKLPTIPYKRMDTARLFSGIQIKANLQADFGTTATAERQDPSSYELDLTVRVRVPRPHQSLPELQKLNPEIPNILPSLESLLSTAKPSVIFEELYQRKIANVQSNLARLDSLLSRHNFFDTETILELEHPDTHRRALLVQADMDVDTDGSDGDRLNATTGESSTFQPFTSYRWPKLSKRPNPFLPEWEKRLRECDKELASDKITPAKRKELSERQSTLKAELVDLKTKSFLVGSLDPYVVLPIPMVSRKGSEPPAKVGDFCVVIHGSRLFPAIVGDAGPTYKSGEASLRLCRELSQKASGGARPESDLKVTYLVFPGTAESPRQVPNYEQWWTRCDSLLQELGGYAGELFFFEDSTKPRPKPTPSPTPFPGDPNFIGPLAPDPNRSQTPGNN